jgi:hypothetical protein
MPTDWSFATDSIHLGGGRIDPADAERQRVTAQEILADLRERPGVILADQVGMGKTYVALAVVASVLTATRAKHGPVIVMVPSRLRHKWQREWEQFKRHCAKPGAFDWVQTKYAHNPAEFLKLLDERDPRCHLVFMTMGCFSLGLRDPWIKLAFIRISRHHTKLSRQQKQRLYRWAPSLVWDATVSRLPVEVVERLMNRAIRDWKSILVEDGVLNEEHGDPVPERLARYEEKRTDAIDWSPLCEFLRHTLPARTSANIRSRLKSIRHEFTEICRQIYGQWLDIVPWKAPLLVLDEAHHAKNDTTRLAKLFRQPSEESIALLQNKFHRMLFLTATPFQLGHDELIRVLRTLRSVRWADSQAPSGSREDFDSAIEKLSNALDQNRLAGRNLDQLWGKLNRETIGNQDVYAWWQKVKESPENAEERQLVESVQRCEQTCRTGEKLLQPWVIRHNRSPMFPAKDGQQAVPRRAAYPGSTTH